MERSCLFCKGFWPFLLLPLLLALLAIAFQWRSIEADVSQNTKLALSDSGVNWVEVNTHDRGREVQLIGTATSQQEIDSAIGIAKQAKGLNSVTWSGTLAEPADTNADASTNISTEQTQTDQVHNLSLAVSDQELILQGNVDPKWLNDTSLEKLGSLFAGKQINNQLSINDGVTGLPEMEGLAGVLANLPAGSSLSIQGDELTLDGTVSSLGLKKKASRSAAAIFNGKVNNQLIVELAEIAQADKVSVDQCQILFNELTASNTVNFETGSNVVLDDSYALLDEFTTLSRRCPEANFEVGGHTDSSGSLELNMTLSQARAEAVVAHIINSGVEASRFSAKGYGPNKPIADNTSEEGKAKNRRVEFTVTNN
jgi:outer membrane protein OmpA-like peptidoglycan-associated protein